MESTNSLSLLSGLDQIFGSLREIENNEIRDKWIDVGGKDGFLGHPILGDLEARDGIGRYALFQGGSIYWTPETGAHEVHGAIRDKWSDFGRVQSFLGYPITDELTTPDEIGRYNHFQGGSIYWTPETGAHEVHGAIRQKWAEKGWERSFLGYPITDELTTPDEIGRYNHFQGGSIYWTPETGAHEVHGAIRQKWAEKGWEQGSLGYPVSDELNGPGNSRYSIFQEGVVYWDPLIGAHLVPGFDVPSEKITSSVDEYILNASDKLYLTGDTEVVAVHDWYELHGKSYRQVLELDLDMKYKRKGKDPRVDLDLFLSFEVQDGNIQATLIHEEHDVNFPTWFNVVSLGIGKIMEAVGDKIAGDELGAYIGQSISQPSGFGFTFDAQLQDDGSLRVFGM